MSLTAKQPQQPKQLQTCSADNPRNVTDIIALQRQGKVKSIAALERDGQRDIKGAIKTLFSAFAKEMAESVKKTLTTGEIEVIADALTDPAEGLAFLTIYDITHFMRLIRRGRWLDYNGLSSMQVCRWLHEYADERLTTAEQLSQQTAHQQQQDIKAVRPQPRLGYSIEVIEVNGVKTQRLKVNPEAIYQPPDKGKSQSELEAEGERQRAELLRQSK